MNYAPDTFTEHDVKTALESAGLKYKDGHRYILSQCPLHEDVNPSVQIYKDDWFVKCHAGCEGGRFHITKAFPGLRSNAVAGQSTQGPPPKRATEKKMTQRVYIQVDLMELWKSLPEIPSDHYFKDIPIDELNNLGWRWDDKNKRYFIPYFSRSRTTIPFGQWRNLLGDVRFNFWKDAKPTLYGTWNLEPGEKIFLVEGCSDAAVMEYCGIPWIAAPSAASGELVKAMAKWAAENNVKLVYAGDNDAAGDKLKDALDEVTSYRVRQPRHPYKDWGEMFEAEGIKSVVNYCHVELFPGEELPWPEIEPGYKKEPVIITDSTPPGPNPFHEIAKEQGLLTDVEKVQLVFPGATEVKIVEGEKKQLETPPTVLY